MAKSSIILFEDYLDELYKNPVCELDYTKDYELLIAVVLSAQTTDKRVNMVTKVLFDRYPTLIDLKDAKEEDIINIIRSIGTYRRKTFFIMEIARILLEEYDGVVPDNRELLIKMPGVGRKVANVVLGELFKKPAIAVDTHVERVSKRLGFADKDDNVLVVEKKLESLLLKDTWAKRHLQMVLFGRYHCKSRKPECDSCKIKDICLYKNT